MVPVSDISKDTTVMDDFWGLIMEKANGAIDLGLAEFSAVIM